MAQDKNQEFNNLNSDKSNSYTKGLIKDYNDTFVPEGVWINAINAVTNSQKGDAGTIGNEPSNVLCATTPYAVIGIIRRDTDTWVVFSTNDVLSEIGIFTESTCTYKKVISDSCLNFKRTNLIYGVVQYNYDCTYSVFFADGTNPDRTINLDNPPYQITGYDTTNAQCPIPIYSNCLDCDAIRLEYLVNPACYSIKKAVGAGSLLNGSYQAVLAYSINGQRVTSYFTPSNIVSIWDHSGVAGGLQIEIDSIDTRFEEYELVIISTVAAQTVARKIGNYSTTQTVVYIDNYSEALPSIDLTLIPLVTPIYDRSDKMFPLNGYLLRSGIYTKYDFNYQPLANQIETYWQEIEYPADYYYKGGVNTSYMRDEQYAFFIRWIYNDGDKSASYHIPGRAATPNDLIEVTGSDVLNPLQNKYWQVYNTATITNSNVNKTLSDGGLITREGRMAYWESSEKYPITNPQVWDILCGANIRHHKFPDNSISHIHNNGGDKIYLLGVRFDNIQQPVDNQGNLITNIIGFEILRGSREGNKTIIAKGLINNMREYKNTNASSKKVLYQNYPYNDLRPDYFLTTSMFSNGESPNDSSTPLKDYRNDYFSFHSPDTNFRKPFLSYDEVRLYTKEYGTIEGTFQYPYGDPKQKLITNTSYLLGLTVGLGIGLRTIFGARQINEASNVSDVGTYATEIAASAQIAGSTGLLGPNILSATALGSLAGTVPLSISSGATASVFGGFTNGTMYGTNGSLTFPTYTQEPGDLTSLDFSSVLPGAAGQVARKVFRAAVTIATLSYYGGQGLDQALNIIYQLIPFRHYSLQFNSHGFYNNYKTITPANLGGSIRRSNNLTTYIKDQIQSFDVTYDINNAYRNNIVTVNTKGVFLPVSSGDPSIEDNSRVRVRDSSVSFNDPTNKIVTVNSQLPKTSAYYAGLKIDYQNQYGQIEGIVQLPIQTCYVSTPSSVKDKRYESGVLFGGDVYINRYTEKNPFFFFTQWLFDMPNGTEFDYSQYSNILYPRYWANFTRFDRSSIKTPLNMNAIIAAATDLNFSGLLQWTKAASSYHHLDRNDAATNTFEVTNGWFYLFNNGVRDFFVESEVNLAYRDYGDLTAERHYDHTGYTDIDSMFRSDIIKAGNYYKYDYSLSVGKLLSNYVSFSSILPRDYDPNVAETCYAYYPKRVLYSLPQQSEQKRDSWRIYLPNNYKEFENIINVIKPINRTGSIILFEDAEPTSVTGVDQLTTGQGTKITIGDGGLFAQPFQTLINADDEYEYASCQDTRSAVNTPYGLFWMSRKTGKILNYTGGQIVDIAMNGMKYWFIQNLPNVLTTQFPEFAATENTVIGIGCQAVYDANYELLYFCKRDYKSKGEVLFNAANQKFYVEKQSGIIDIQLGDPEYFEDCSWTISYDPKTKMWLSFHDWHPDYVLGTNDHFYTLKNNGFWKHNAICNSYCNFYNKNYSFEVEFPVNTGATITTMKSLEYTLEVLNYSTDCIDPYHVFDQNFDYAMVYNTEQNSGLLKLYLKPYNPSELIQYPKVQTDFIEILYAKEENKYRFNQFWDSTRDRGEFTGNEYRMFNTEQNGYRKVLNPNYINYAKSPLERKKFRHYGNRLILGKYISNNLKFNLKVVNTKETYSPR
jgi:hypothetical protein